MAVPYDVELIDELLMWLLSLDSREAEDWVDKLRPWADEYRIKVINEQRAYERGYRQGQLNAFQQIANRVRIAQEVVTADAELASVRLEKDQNNG